MRSLDLRLVPGAVAGWIAALVLVAGDQGTAVVVGVAAAALSLGAAALVRRARGRDVLVHVAVAGCVVACISGAVAGQWQGRAPVTALVGDPGAAGRTVQLEGVVASGASPMASGFGGEPRYWLDLDVRAVEAGPSDARVRSRVHAPVRVMGGDELLAASYGSTVSVRGTLRAAGAGDAAVAILSVRAPADGTAVVRELDPPGAITRTTNTIRAAFMAASDELSPQGRGLVPGVAIGDTSMLPPALDDALVVTSLTHITAVSGSHFAIIAAAVFGLCAVLRVPRGARVVVAGAAMTAFVLLVHPEPSVLRAAVMGAVSLLAIVLGRPGQAVPALAVTVLVLLLVDPWLARSFGFALSVLATAGLVLGTPPVARVLRRFLPDWLALAVAVPFAAQLACAPVVVLLDPSVSLYAVPANLLAAPALVPATVLGVVGALLAPGWPAAATALAHVASWSTWWIAEVAGLFAAAPAARVPWPGGVLGVGLLAGATLAGIVVTMRWRHWWWSARTALFVAGMAGSPTRPRPRRAPDVEHLRSRGGPLGAAFRPLAPLVGVLGVALALVVAVALLRPPWIGDVLGRAPGGTLGWAPDAEVVMCDVGQGDAMIVPTAPGHALMVDVGPRDGGVGACLDDLGVTHLDLLVLTHFHEDHVGGLEDALTGRTVSAVLVSPVEEPVDQTSRTRRLLEDAGVPMTTAAAGLTGELGDVLWEVVAPAPQTARASSGGSARAPTHRGEEADGGANDGSIVVSLRTGHLSVVALGDLEDEGQRALLEALRARGQGEVDVVKVAHHGSRTQDVGLARLLSPRIALVSSGADNTYGHPHADTLALYREVGAAVLRTDTCGTFGLVVRGTDTLVAGSCT